MTAPIAFELPPLGHSLRQFQGLSAALGESHGLTASCTLLHKNQDVERTGKIYPPEARQPTHRLLIDGSRSSSSGMLLHLALPHQYRDSPKRKQPITRSPRKRGPQTSPPTVEDFVRQIMGQLASNGALVRHAPTAPSQTISPKLILSSSLIAGFRGL